MCSSHLSWPFIRSQSFGFQLLWPFRLFYRFFFSLSLKSAFLRSEQSQCRSKLRCAKYFLSFRTERNHANYERFSLALAELNVSQSDKIKWIHLTMKMSPVCNHWQATDSLLNQCYAQSSTTIVCFVKFTVVAHAIHAHRRERTYTKTRNKKSEDHLR